MFKKNRKSVWNKKASDMTIGESLKISGVITLVASGICAIPLIFEYKDEISSAIRSKFSKEDED
jgi:hypothetical protein